MVTVLPDRRIPVVLSAHDDDLIAQDAAAILAYLDREPVPPDVAAVSSTLLRTRRPRRHRALVRAADTRELADGLRALAAGDDHSLVTRSSAAAGHRTAFVFPGQGSQWPSMGAEAYDWLPHYRAEADACAEAFAATGAVSPMAYLLADPGAAHSDFTQVQNQGAQFVHGVALARVWRTCGVLPDITVGHSLGEIGAAYVAGAVTLAEAVQVVIARATLLDGLTGPYRVAVLGIGADEAQDVIARTAGWVELSVVNSPSSVAVSGDHDAVAAVVRTVVDRGSFAKAIEMWFPAHTTALDPLRAQLEPMLPAGRFADTPVQFIGSATADVVAAGTDFADYWYANLRSTVRFDRAIDAAVGRGARTYVELSAHPALAFAMGDLLDDLPDGPALIVGSGRRDEPIVDRLSANIAAVALADSGYRWAELLGEPRQPLRDFPFAPMRAQHLWAVREPMANVAELSVAVEHWESIPATRATSQPLRAAAVIDLADDERLADALRSAVGRRDGVAEVGPADAAVLIVVAPTLDQLDAPGAAGELTRRVTDGMLDYVDAIGPHCQDVWLVTAGGERVRAAEPGPLPALAALAAMHRSVGFEHPEQRFAHLDVASRELSRTTADTVVEAILGADDDVAVRDTEVGTTIYRRSMRTAPASPPTWPGSVFDEVLITGGSGSVGIQFARFLVDHGARRIVLLSRGGLDAAALADLNGTPGVEVLAPRCDITDVAALTAAAAEFSRAGASLVIHAAGVAVIAPHRELTETAWEATVAAKVSGLDHLVEVWPLRADARILLCSSISGLWGGRGHAAYAAANRLLDVMADQLRAAGRACTSVRWGLWEGSGIIDADEIARVARSGLRPMTPQRAIRAGLSEYGSDPLVFCADPTRLQTFLGLGTILAAIEPPAVDTAPIDATSAVRRALGSVLKLADPTAVDLDESLLDLGVDSLLALDLRKNLKKATGRSVPLATILGGVTATELIAHLEAQRKELA